MRRRPPGSTLTDTRFPYTTRVRSRAHGRDAATVVAEVVDALAGIFAAGIPVVAYNAPYDFSLLKHEALRHDVTPLAAPSPVIDPLVVDKRYDRYRRGKRTLSVVEIGRAPV